MTMLNYAFKRVLALAVVVAASASCGDVVRTGRSPSYLVVDLLEARQGQTTTGRASGVLFSDVITGGTIFADTGEVTLSAAFKNVNSVTAPTTNNDITITRYHVQYRRADGRNQEGVDVPYGFDAGATGTVSVGGTLTLTFVLLRNVAKLETPLVQLASNLNVLSTIAEVTFYGRDQAGNEVNVTGTISIEFANYGDA
jgi:hypothetical protein